MLNNIVHLIYLYVLPGFLTVLLWNVFNNLVHHFEHVRIETQTLNIINSTKTAAVFYLTVTTRMMRHTTGASTVQVGQWCSGPVKYYPNLVYSVGELGKKKQLHLCNKRRLTTYSSCSFQMIVIPRPNPCVTTEELKPLPLRSLKSNPVLLLLC